MFALKGGAIMTEKEVTDIRFNLNDLKGRYTGTVNASFLNNEPDGFGKAIFNNGDQIEGRFKNGAFVDGTAISKNGVVCKGQFDNLRFLSGTVTYPNGDYLKCEVNPKTNKPEIREFRVTQKFGDVIEGKYTYTDEKTNITATQTFADGSTITGEFQETSPNNIDEEFAKDFVTNSAFGIGRNIYNCIQGQANINLSQNPKIKAVLSGTYSNINKKTAQIKGVYEYDDGNTYKLMEGNFTFNNRINRQNQEAYHQFSENFEEFSTNTQDVSKQNFEKAFKVEKLPYIYSINFEQGTMLIKDNIGSFNGTKLATNDKTKQNRFVTSQATIYKGTLTNKDNTIKIKGHFASALHPTMCTIEVLPNTKFSGTFKGKFTQTGTNTDIISTKIDGILDTKQSHKEGVFQGIINLNRGANKMLCNNLEMQLDFLKGNFTQQLVNGSYFEGKIYEPYSVEDDLYKITQSSLAKNIFAIGTLTKSTSKGDLIFTKHGMFDKSYKLFEGDIDENRLLNGRSVHFTGKKTFDNEQEIFGYTGQLTYLDNKDYYDGEFNEDFAFQKGKLQEHYENGTVFTGSTQDLISYQGKLERTNDFWQDGEFEVIDGERIFKRGNTLVHFNRKDNLYCFAEYDEAGFPNFDGYKYICNIKSAENKKTNLVASNSISEAVVEYDYKNNLENPTFDENNEVYTKEQMQKILNDVIANYEAQITEMNNKQQTLKKEVQQGLGGIALALHDIGDELEKQVQKRKMQAQQPQTEQQKTL